MRHPPHAYIPGLTARHPDGAFDVIRDSVAPGMSAAELAGSDAFVTGLRFLDEGLYWEAHEVLEPVWMACLDPSPEREAVQALIQVANAGVKARMGRPRAVARIAALVEGHLAGMGSGPILGQSADGIRARLEAVCAEIAL